MSGRRACFTPSYDVPNRIGRSRFPPNCEFFLRLTHALLRDHALRERHCWNEGVWEPERGSSLKPIRVKSAVIAPNTAIIMRYFISFSLLLHALRAGSPGLKLWGIFSCP